MFIMNNLKKLDMFGARAELYFSKESTFKSAFGGFLTIVVWICFMIMITPKLSNLITRAEINENEKIRYSPSEGLIDLGREGLMVAIGFSNPAFNNYVNITLIGRKNTRNSTTGAIIKNKVEISLTKCTTEHFPGLENSFKVLNLNGFLCPTLNETWKISGTYTDEVFNFLQIRISECRNVSKCADRQLFLSKNPQLDLNIFLTSHDNNPRDNDTPLLKKITSELHFLLDNKDINVLYKEADIFLRTLQVSYDRELILPVADNRVFNGIMYSNEVKEQISASTNSGDLANFYLRKSPYIVEIERKFYTFGEFFAFYGGAWSQLFFTFYFFGMYYNKKKYLNQLANKIYNFKTDNQREGEAKMSDAKNVLYQKKNDSSNTTRNKSVTEILLGIYEYFMKGNILKSSFCETYFSSCYKFVRRQQNQNHNLELIETSFDCISEDLDLLKIIKAIQDLERLKHLILTEDQRLLFEFCPKPIITYNKVLRRGEKLLSQTFTTTKSLTRESTHQPFYSIDSKTFRKRNVFLDFDNIDVYKKLIKVYFQTKKKNSQKEKRENGLEVFDDYLIKNLENDIFILKELRNAPDEEIEKLFKECDNNNQEDDDCEAGKADRLFVRVKAPRDYLPNSKNNEKESHDVKLENLGVDFMSNSTGSFSTIKIK